MMFVINYHHTYRVYLNFNFSFIQVWLNTKISWLIIYLCTFYVADYLAMFLIISNMNWESKDNLEHKTLKKKKMKFHCHLIQIKIHEMYSEDIIGNGDVA